MEHKNFDGKNKRKHFFLCYFALFLIDEREMCAKDNNASLHVNASSFSCAMKRFYAKFLCPIFQKCAKKAGENFEAILNV